MMNREKALAKNTVILSLGTFLPKVSAMVTLPLLTGYLSTTEYGIYDLIITLVSLLLPAVTLQIQSAAFRFLINTRRDKEKSAEIISNILMFTMVVSVISLCIVYFALFKIERTIRILITVYFFLDIILISLRQIIRGIGDNMGYAIESVMNSIIMLLGTAFFVAFLRKGLPGVLTAMSIATLFGIIYISWRSNIKLYIGSKYCSLIKLKELLSYSWPMVPNNLSGWVLSLSDRMVITGFLGVEANAIYAVANKIPNLLKAFQSTFTFAWQENASLSVDDKDSKEYYSKMFDGISCLLVGGLSLLIAISPVMFHLLIRGNYEDAYYQMPILYIGAYFSVISGILGGIYIAHMKTKSVGITTVIAAIVNLAIDFLLVKKIGIYAGSISTLVSYLFLLIYRMIDIQKFQEMNFNVKKLLVGISCLAAEAVLIYQHSVFFDLLCLILSTLTALLFNKMIIKVLIEKTTKKLRKRFIYAKKLS